MYIILVIATISVLGNKPWCSVLPNTPNACAAQDKKDCNGNPSYYCFYQTKEECEASKLYSFEYCTEKKNA